jgi:hypothetical protein
MAMKSFYSPDAVGITMVSAPFRADMRSGGSVLMQQLPYILAGIVLMTLQPVLVTLSQNAQGHLDYSPISSTLLTGAGPD